MEKPEPSLKYDGMMFTHCRQCLVERPAEITPREWARLEVGVVEDDEGTHWIVVNCVRHEVAVSVLPYKEDEPIPSCGGYAEEIRQ